MSLNSIKINYKIYKSAAQAVGFYDSPLWWEKEPKPDYFNLFSWSKWGELSDKMGGSLKEELFDTLEKKISYLQGVFDDYSGADIRKGGNSICFANSQHKVERCKKWLNEIAREKELGGFTYYAVESHNVTYSVPICHTVVIHPEVVEYIKNYQL